MKKKNLIFLVVLILLSYGFIFIKYNEISERANRMQASIDSEFAVEIARISAGIDEGEVPSILSIEHAFKISALAQHTSFETRNNVSYASLLADTIRHKYLNNMPIRNAEKIKELFLQLSANPENRSLADEIMQLIKAE